jgi:hypothetical protein
LVVGNFLVGIEGHVEVDLLRAKTVVGICDHEELVVIDLLG